MKNLWQRVHRAYELTLLWCNESGYGQRPIDIGIIDALAEHDHFRTDHLQGAECTIAMPHLEGEYEMGCGAGRYPPIALPAGIIASSS